MFQLAAARRRLVDISLSMEIDSGFNSQPREGGWSGQWRCKPSLVGFQLAAARRRLGRDLIGLNAAHLFQLAAARRRLVGAVPPTLSQKTRFNSQPREGGWFLLVRLPL